MELSQLRDLLPIMRQNGVTLLKTSKTSLEIHFKHDEVSVTTKDGKTITASGVDIKAQEPVQTIKSDSAPIPTDSLEQENGMSYDQVLNWSTESNDSVPGTDDQVINDTPMTEPKIMTGII